MTKKKTNDKSLDYPKKTGNNLSKPKSDTMLTNFYKSPSFVIIIFLVLGTLASFFYDKKINFNSLQIGGDGGEKKSLVYIGFTALTIFFILATIYTQLYRTGYENNKQLGMFLSLFIIFYCLNQFEPIEYAPRKISKIQIYTLVVFLMMIYIEPLEKSKYKYIIFPLLIFSLFLAL